MWRRGEGRTAVVSDRRKGRGGQRERERETEREREEGREREKGRERRTEVKELKSRGRAM